MLGIPSGSPGRTRCGLPSRSAWRPDEEDRIREISSAFPRSPSPSGRLPTTSRRDCRSRGGRPGDPCRDPAFLPTPSSGRPPTRVVSRRTSGRPFNLRLRTASPRPGAHPAGSSPWAGCSGFLPDRPGEPGAGSRAAARGDRTKKIGSGRSPRRSRDLRVPFGQTANDLSVRGRSRGRPPATTGDHRADPALRRFPRAFERAAGLAGFSGGPATAAPAVGESPVLTGGCGRRRRPPEAHSARSSPCAGRSGISCGWPGRSRCGSRGAARGDRRRR